MLCRTLDLFFLCIFTGESYTRKTTGVNLNVYFKGRQISKSVEPRTLEVGVPGSKPVLGTGDGVGSHLTIPIRRDARSWMTKTLETDTDN